MRLCHQTTGEVREFTLRAFRPGDAPQVIACIRDAYGETYVKPWLYTEESVLTCEERGTLRFSVAETAEGRLAGITAYERSERFPGMAEIACQVILRSCQGFGLALPLARHAMHRAEREPLTGQFSRALGCHQVSQKTLRDMGFTACGFLLNVFDKTRLLHHFPNGHYDKIPQSVAVKRQFGGDAGRLWLPPELRTLGGETLRALGCRWTPLPSGQRPEAGDRWDREEDLRHATLTLWARTCGEGFGEHLAEQVARVTDRPGQTVNLYLNLGRPGSETAYRAARAQGFVFTGFLPCTAEGVYLILHQPLRLSAALDGGLYGPEYAPFAEQIRRQLWQRQ